MLKQNLNHHVLVDVVEHLDNELIVLNNQIHEEIDRNLNFHHVLNDNVTKSDQFLYEEFQVEDKD